MSPILSYVQVCERAAKLHKKGELERALQLYIRVVESHPEHTLAMDSAAEVLAEMGSESAAKELVLRSIALQPGTWRARGEGGGLHLMTTLTTLLCLHCHH